MSKLISGKISGIAIAALLGLAVTTPLQAQGTAQKIENSMERGAKSITRQPNAPLRNSMTQAQARKACQSELKGTRESKSALRTKMNFCINEKMQGNS